MNIIHWHGLTPYPVGLERMEDAVHEVTQGGVERVFICQHEDVFTVGTSGDAAKEVLAAGHVPVIDSGRGGKVTYHGPGQVVVYPIIDLSKHGKDLRAYVKSLQEVIIAVLWAFGVRGLITDDVGVWVKTGSGERGTEDGELKKVAAVGVRVRRWVAFHGFALNIDCNMEMFGRIVPCGIADKGVTSLRELGVEADFDKVVEVIEREVRARWGGVSGPLGPAAI